MCKSAGSSTPVGDVSFRWNTPANSMLISSYALLSPVSFAPAFARNTPYESYARINDFDSAALTEIRCEPSPGSNQYSVSAPPDDSVPVKSKFTSISSIEVPLFESLTKCVFPGEPSMSTDISISDVASPPPIQPEKMKQEAKMMTRALSRMKFNSH